LCGTEKNKGRVQRIVAKTKKKTKKNKKGVPVWA